MAWTTPRTWVAGETITDSIGNTHWRDNFNALGTPGAWTAYSPVWTATTTNPTNFTITGRYIQTFTKKFDVQIVITPGAGFTAGSGTYNVTLPVPTTSAQKQVLSAQYYAAGPEYQGSARVDASVSTITRVAFNNAAWSATSPVAPVSGHIIIIGGAFEGA